MKKIVRTLIFLFAVVAIFEISNLFADKESLRKNMIRLHVVAQSDSSYDQEVKLQVKDAILSFLEEHMPRDMNIQDAKTYLRSNLQQLERVANETLAQHDSKDSACVSLSEESFPTRSYDTFVLPSGVYESLRVIIGDGKGENWWCVVFPALCAGETLQEYEELAAGAGFSESLVHATARRSDYEIRFFLLDCIGKLENFFHFR